MTLKEDIKRFKNIEKGIMQDVYTNLIVKEKDFTKVSKRHMEGYNEMIDIIKEYAFSFDNIFPFYSNDIQFMMQDSMNKVKEKYTRNEVARYYYYEGNLKAIEDYILGRI